MGLDLRGLGGELQQCWLSLSSTWVQHGLYSLVKCMYSKVWGPKLGQRCRPRLSTSQHPQGSRYPMCGVVGPRG